jgi:hypothetical protein
MRINSSELAYTSSHSLAVSETEQVSARAWTDGGSSGAVEGQEARAAVSVSLSLEARVRMVLESVQGLVEPAAGLTSATSQAQAMAEPSAQAASGAQAASVDGSEPEMMDAKLLLLKALVESFTGRRIHLSSLVSGRGGDDSGAAAPAEEPQGAAAAAAPARAGWGVEAEVTRVKSEAESTRFTAAGVVKTADGRTITLAAQLTMSRASVTVENATLRAGDAPLKDPLVLNFGGTAAELGLPVAFDLDADGKAESMPFVGAGSALLFYDANGDGRATDGKELFGAATGDAYGELARLDDDGNGWIDEGDAAWTRLGVWSRAGGEDVVRTLDQAGVGALAVASARTPFTLKQGDATVGVVRATGLYLAQDGRVGTTQQVDVATTPAAAPAAAPAAVLCAPDDPRVS